MPPKAVAARATESKDKKESAEKKLQDEQKDEELVLAQNLQKNMMMMQHCRTAAGIVAGIVAGILHMGLIGGVLVFLVVSAAMGGLIYYKLGGKGRTFFMKDQDLFFNNAFGGMLSFLLVWIMAYDIVHIF